jgi:hypothetical protein
MRYWGIGNRISAEITPFAGVTAPLLAGPVPERQGNSDKIPPKPLTLDAQEAIDPRPAVLFVQSCTAHPINISGFEVSFL